MLMFLGVLLLVIITIFFRFEAGNWTAPGPIFAGYWSLAVIAALLLAPQGFPVTASSVFWIALSVFSLGIGSMLGRFGRKETPAGVKEFTLGKLNNIHKPIFIFSFLGLMGTLYLVKSLGYGIGIFFSLEAFKALSSSVSEARYVDGYKPPTLYNILLCFTYAAAYLGGMQLAIKKTYISFLPFVPVILSSLVMTTKASILFPVFFWLAGWLSLRVQLGKTKIQFKLVLRFCLLILGLTGLFVITSMLRYSKYSSTSLSLIYEKLTVYYVGFLSGFSQWFSSSYYNLGTPSFGTYTLAGIFDLIGIKDKNQGILNDFVAVGHYTTNIYTLFRYLILDVGLPGSLILLFIVGFGSAKMYEKTRQGSFLALPFLAMFYAQVLFSNTTTIFGYNTIIFSSGIIFLYLARHKFTLNKRLVNTSDKKATLPKRKIKLIKLKRITW